MTFRLLILSILCFATTSARSQITQQIDTAPSAQGWVQADTTGVSFGANTIVTINTLPNLDTAWAYPLIWTANSHLLKWERPNIKLTGNPWFFSGAYGFFLEAGDIVIRTTDAGLTWDTLHSGMVNSASGCLPSPAEFFLCGSAPNGIARTLDSGRTWTINDTIKANAIAFADDPTKTQYHRYTFYTVGNIEFPYPPSPDGAVVYKSTDQGDTWKTIYTGIMANLQTLAVTDANTIYAGGDSGEWIHKSTDGGQSWYRIATGSTGEIWDMCFPSFKHGIAVGGGGIIVTNDSGHTWTRQLKIGLYHVRFHDDSVGVATGANGTILVTNNGGKSWVGPPPVHDSLTVQVFPNPSSDEAQISYTLKKPGHVTLTIFDVSGNAVMTPLHYVYQGGSETVPLNTASLSPGDYYYRLQSEGYMTQGTFTVIR